MSNVELDPYYDADKILAVNKATVEYGDESIDAYGNRSKCKEIAGWSLCWKHGCIGWLKPKWTQEQANRAGAMFIYLWEKKVEAGTASSLAEVWADNVTMRIL